MRLSPNKQTISGFEDDSMTPLVVSLSVAIGLMYLLAVAQWAVSLIKEVKNDVQ